jgi:hypothetical protein
MIMQGHPYCVCGARIRFYGDLTVKSGATTLLFDVSAQDDGNEHQWRVQGDDEGYIPPWAFFFF